MQAFYDGMTLVGSIVVMVLVLILTFYGSRWYAGRLKQSSSGRHIKIVDRASVGPGCSLIVAQTGSKFYLIGASEKNMQLLCELDSVDIELPDIPEKPLPFSQLLQNVLTKTGNQKDSGNEK